MPTIIIGMGNPVRGDDAVGLEVVRQLRARLGSRRDVETGELYCGGIQLMEAMIGFDRAFVIDAMITGERAGTIRAFARDEAADTRTIHSTHNGNLQVALELGRAAGLRVPGEIRIWGVEAGETGIVGERLTPQVQRAVPEVVERVLEELRAELLKNAQERCA